MLKNIKVTKPVCIITLLGWLGNVIVCAPNYSSPIQATPTALFGGGGCRCPINRVFTLRARNSIVLLETRAGHFGPL